MRYLCSPKVEADPLKGPDPPSKLSELRVSSLGCRVPYRVQGSLNPKP